MIELVKKTITFIEDNKMVSSSEIENAKHIFEQSTHVILSQGKEKITVHVDNNKELFEVALILEEGNLYAKIDGSFSEWNVPSLVALYVIENSINDETLTEGVRYLREGMQKRVLEERKDRAQKANYKISLANNLYGEHTLINEKGKTFKITLRDFKNETGYINNRFENQ